MSFLPEISTNSSFRVNTETRPLFLDIQYQDGSRTGLPYSMLRKVDFDLSEGLTLSFYGYEIIVRGINLEEIYGAILDQTLSFLQEQGDRYQEIENTVNPYIERIIVEEKD